MTETRKLRVFLCHSSQDKPIVRELYQRLNAEGWIDPWLDEEKLLPGQDWDMEIYKATRDADAIIICLSKISVTKEGYVNKEIRRALDIAQEKADGTIYVIPLRLDDCIPSFEQLKKLHWGDYFAPKFHERLIKSLQARAISLGCQVSSQVINEKRTLTGKHIYIFAGIEFVKVPAGEFLMGSVDDDKKAYESEKPQHKVILPYDYFIGRFPLTNSQFASFAKIYRIERYGTETTPVIWVSWLQVQAYLRWLNKTQQSILPQGLVFRLSTEAEWEKAARGLDGRIYPWGNEFNPYKCNTEEGGLRGIVTPVDAYSPEGDSPFGCADMSGNVWEWTQSLHKPYPYVTNDGRENEISERDWRVVRGGSSSHDFSDARCAHRDSKPIRNGHERTGFRVVIAPPLW